MVAARLKLDILASGWSAASERKSDVLPVKDSYHYPLPHGLAPGARVKLVAYDHGYWTVESSGKIYSVFGPLVDAGFAYLLNGRWLAAADPRVIARKQAEALVDSPAHSPVNFGCVNSPV